MVYVGNGGRESVYTTDGGDTFVALGPIPYRADSFCAVAVDANTILIYAGRRFPRVNNTYVCMRNKIPTITTISSQLKANFSLPERTVGEYEHAISMRA